MLTDIIIVISIMILGIGIGLIIGNRPKVIKIISLFTSFSIFLLLFLLGIGVGTNTKLVNNLDSIGLQAFVISIGALAGSLICAFFTYNLFFKKK
ncbi:LysO family transporter [Labilibaculum sp.]|uniref:LysO family transporter n=1 Tax=Labilibaculum sp. TaxID=2060723 RepID=UPI0035651843